MAKSAAAGMAAAASEASLVAARVSRVNAVFAFFFATMVEAARVAGGGYGRGSRWTSGDG